MKTLESRGSTDFDRYEGLLYDQQSVKSKKNIFSPSTRKVREIFTNSHKIMSDPQNMAENEIWVPEFKFLEPSMKKKLVRVKSNDCLLPLKTKKAINLEEIMISLENKNKCWKSNGTEMKRGINHKRNSKIKLSKPFIKFLSATEKNTKSNKRVVNLDIQKNKGIT